MSRRLRIVRVMPFFHASHGGSVTQAVATCRELASRGHHVRVVTSDLAQSAAVPRDTWIERDGFMVWHARVGAFGRVPPYWQPELARPLATCLRDADVLCVNVGLSLTSSLARRLAARHAVPFVYNAEGALCPTRLRDKSLRKRLFLWLHERRTLRVAAAIHAVTTKERDDVVAQGAEPSRVHVIPNGVALPAQPVLRAVARERLGWPANDFVMLFLGRLVAMKGPDVLLAAAVPLLRQGNARLVFAGPDNGMAAALARAAATNGVAERVHFAGVVEGAMTRDHLAGADVFVLPSRSEGLPLGPLEAAAHGLPLLVSPECNLPEVAQCDAGSVVANDATALGRALAEIAGDVELRHRRAQNARRMVAQHFALATVVDRLEGLYTRLLRG
jgi:glycosyltransferase involved in cell wall biosynthesis